MSIAPVITVGSEVPFMRAEPSAQGLKLVLSCLRHAYCMIGKEQEPVSISSACKAAQTNNYKNAWMQDRDKKGLMCAGCWMAQQ